MKKKVFISFLILGICLSCLVSTIDASPRFVGSKNSDVYHYEDCYYVDRIKPENLIYFDTPEEAIAAGYHPCKVCNPPESSITRLTPTQTPKPTTTPTVIPTATSLSTTAGPSPTTTSTAIPTTKAPEESGFEAVFSIAIILVIAYFVLKISI
jgi:hypothetical protein